VSEISYFLGLDLGQAQDYTAIVVAERLELPAVPARPTPQVHYHLRHLERCPLRTAYPAIVVRVALLLQQEPLYGRTRLVADATGVGAPVIDLLRQARLDPVAVTITSGNAVTEDEHERDCYGVPKRDLVATMQVLLQSERLKIAERLPEAATLTRELLGFQTRITTAANDIYGTWREGAHDDLLLATALACWYGERPSADWRLL
jgi:hypothetical protein